MGYLLVLGAAILWGFLGPVARFALQDGVGPLELAFWRAALAGVLFAGHAALRRQVRVAARDLPAVLGFGLVGVAVFYASYLAAVQHGGAALASVLLYTAPVWVALSAVALLRERLGWRGAAAVALCVGGVAGIAMTSGGALAFSGIAVVWGLVAGWSYALHYLFGRRYFARYGSATLYCWILPIGALALLPFADLTSATTARAWAAIAFVAVVPTYLAYLCYASALRRMEATRAATIATIEPVVAGVAAFAIWDERWPAIAYACAVLVLAGVLLVVVRGPAVAKVPATREIG